MTRTDKGQEKRIPVKDRSYRFYRGQINNRTKTPEPAFAGTGVFLSTDLFYSLFFVAPATGILTKNLRQCAKKLGVLFGLHDTETDVAVVQKREGRTVADHQPFADTVVKN